MFGVSVNYSVVDETVATEQTEHYGWAAPAPHSATYINAVVRELVAEVRPRDVLDVGCGNGALAAELAADGYHVVGIDADTHGIALARARAPGVTFVRSVFSGDPASLGATADGRVDVVVSTEVIEHLYAPHDLVRFAFAGLRPGGRFIITTPYHGFLKNLALSLVNGWDNHFSADWHGGHIKFWSRRTLSTLLEQEGFRVIGFRGVGRMPYLWKSMILIAERPAA